MLATAVASRFTPTGGASAPPERGGVIERDRFGGQPSYLALPVNPCASIATLYAAPRPTM